MTSLASRRDAQARHALWVELEWRKCAGDFLYFLTTHVCVESKRDPRGWEPFKPLDYQMEDAQAFLEHRYIVVLKARQLGLSTLLMAYSLWLLLFKPGGARVLALANTGENADGLIQKLGVQYRLLPEWLRKRGPQVVKSGTSHMVFEHRDGSESFMRSLSATKTAGASNTADLVILDEFALAEYQQETYKTVEPTTFAAAQNPSHKGAVMVVCSTARGGANLFAKIYKAAVKGENQFHPIFHPWNVSPFVPPGEYAKQKKLWEAAGEPHMIFSEMPETAEQAFSESGARRFPVLPGADVVDDYLFRYAFDAATGEFAPDLAGELWVRSEPQPHYSYVVSCDPASGSGGDYTSVRVGAVNEAGNVELVAHLYSNRLGEVEIARRLDALGKRYAGRDRAALVSVERQGGYGTAVIQELSLHLHYPNIYAHVPPGMRRAKVEAPYGFPCHPTKRPVYLGKLAELLASTAHPDNGGATIIGLDPVVYSELQTFVVKPNGRVEHDTGCHDDTVMALTYLVWILSERGLSAPRPINREDSTDPHWGRGTLDQVWESVKKAEAAQAKEFSRWQRDLGRANRKRDRRESRPRR